MILSLKDFVLTGKLGNIAVGSSRTEVQKIFGSPPRRLKRSNGTSALEYNGFHFFYSTRSEKIYAILCQDFDDSFTELPTSNVFKISDLVSFDTEFFSISEEMKYSDVMNFLRTEDIQYSEESHKFWDKIVCESGVEFLFNNWLEYPEDEDYDRGELILCGFRIFPVKRR